MTFERIVASSQETRALDLALEGELGLRTIDLMEIAGAGSFILLRARVQSARRTIVVAGPGHNGGDGFVIARYVAAAGRRVEVFGMKAPPQAGAPAAQLERLGRFGVAPSFGTLPALEKALQDEGTLVVDALFGTGISFPLRPDAVAWIDALNRARSPIASIDLPSGLDGDTGDAPSGCVRGSVTLAIGTVKAGLLTPAGASHAGTVEVVPLPYPPRLTAGLRRLR